MTSVRGATTACWAARCHRAARLHMQDPKKLIAFLKELKALCDEHDMQIEAIAQLEARDA